MPPAASIIITNYNYQPYLRAAIDSALEQRVAARDAARDVEVIVVDDGSRDGSRQIIESYGDRIIPVMKENGGQASAINAGVARSRGDVVLLLDADDVLLPTAVETSIEALSRGGASKVHWAMRVMDEQGHGEGRLHPNGDLPDGDYFDALVQQGPWMCEAPPTSGNAWSRRFLELVVPIPEAEWRICADAYLLAAAPLFGEIRRIDRPQSCYRLHDRNNYWNQPFAEAIRRSVAIYERQCAAASALLTRSAVAHDPSQWLAHSWWHRLRDAVRDIEAIVPPGASFILVDDDRWGTPDDLEGRRRLAYPQVDGRYTGPPATDDDALAALHRLRARGPRFIIFGWPAFWYLDHFAGLRDHLETHARQIESNDRIRAFDLRPDTR